MSRQGSAPAPAPAAAGPVPLEESHDGASSLLVGESDPLKPPSGDSTTPSLPFSHAPVAWLWSRTPYNWELLVLLIAAATRFWRLADPSGVVFDETHFGKFTAHYQRGSYVFDIHPPLGKMSFAFLGWLMGYDSSKCRYEAINEAYSHDCEYFKLRGISATFGSLLAPLTFRIARELGCSCYAGFLAACFVIFDMLNTTESRLVLMDAQLMFYTALSLLLGILFFKYYASLASPTPSSSPSRFTLNQWVLALGFVCGCAVSIKWTALVTPAVILVECCFGVWFLGRSPVPLSVLLKLGFTIVATYVFWFWVHFWSLPLTGDRASAFIPVEFSAPYQKTLVGGENYNPDSSPSFLLHTFPQLNYEMWLVNTKMTQPHAWSSKYWQWVINDRGMGYWSGSKKTEVDIDESAAIVSRTVYLLGSPVVIWFTSAAVLVWACLCAWNVRYGVSSPLSSVQNRTLVVCSFLMFAWLFNLLPYIAVNRTSFIYHYMPGLLYAELSAALLLDGFTRGRLRTVLISVVLLATVTCFVYFSPWVYSFPLAERSRQEKRWFSGWS